MRVATGFHRLAILLAAIPALSAGFWACIYLFGGGEDKTDPFWFMILSAAATALTYAAVRAVGWVVAGFVGSRE